MMLQEINWPLMIFVAGAIFQAGGTFYMIIEHGRQIKEIKIKQNEIERGIKAKLYDGKSRPIYLPADTCVENRRDCKEQRTKEMDYLAGEMRLMRSEFGNHVESHSDMLAILADLKSAVSRNS